MGFCILLIYTMTFAISIRRVHQSFVLKHCIMRWHDISTLNFSNQSFNPDIMNRFIPKFSMVISNPSSAQRCVSSSKSSGKETGKMPLYSVSVCITNFVTGWILLSWNILGNNFEILKVWGSSAGLWGDEYWWSSFGGSCRFYWGLALLGSCWENQMAFYQKSSEGYFLGLWEVCWGSTQRSGAPMGMWTRGVHTKFWQPA